MNKPTKPLGRKAYGSIPHLPDSLLGSGDHFIDPGQAAILTKPTQHKFDNIIVREKLDGSCVAIHRGEDCLTPLMRSGYACIDSRYYQHYAFAKWMTFYFDEFYEMLEPGERIVGEWLLQVHSIRYTIESQEMLFRPFDIMVETDRLTTNEFHHKIREYPFRAPNLIHAGGPISVREAWHQMMDGNQTPTEDDDPEGLVWRCERHGKVEFLAKWVRPSVTPGRFMKENLWNYDPHFRTPD